MESCTYISGESFEFCITPNLNVGHIIRLRSLCENPCNQPNLSQFYTVSRGGYTICVQVCAQLCGEPSEISAILTDIYAEIAIANDRSRITISYSNITNKNNIIDKLSDYEMEDLIDKYGNQLKLVTDVRYNHSTMRCRYFTCKLLANGLAYYTSNDCKKSKYKISRCIASAIERYHKRDARFSINIKTYKSAKDLTIPQLQRVVQKINSYPHLDFKNAALSDDGTRIYMVIPPNTSAKIIAKALASICNSVGKGH